MPLQFSSQVPKQAHQIIADYLAGLSAHSVSAALSPVRLVSAGFRVYSLSLADLAAAQPLQNLQNLQAGLWRYLLLEDQHALAEIDLEDGGSVVALHQSPRADGLRQAVAAAELLPQTQQKTFEMRYLQCLGIHFMALWLHAEASAEDLFLPCRPDQTGLTPDTPYSLPQIVAALRPQAAAIERAMAAPGGDRAGN